MSELATDAEAAVLVGEEVQMALTAVRKYLSKIRGDYRNNLRKPGNEHYAATQLRRFDNYLDPYVLLGGNPDDVNDPEGDE